MSDQNRLVFEKLLAALNAKDMDTMEALIDNDFVDNDAMPGMPAGKAGMLGAMQMFVTAFSDLHTQVDKWVCEGDLVVAVMTSSGTQSGDFMGIPPSGKKFSVREIHVAKIVNGKLVEHWGLGNDMSMMQQLGAIPE
jgi:steroid delta-isomerase-like uncharacterized protein